MINAAASTCEKPSGNGRHSSAAAMAWVPNPPGPGTQGTLLSRLHSPTPTPASPPPALLFGAGDEGQGGVFLVFVVRDQQMGKIQAGGPDRDQHFAGLGR